MWTNVQITIPITFWNVFRNVILVHVNTPHVNPSILLYTGVKLPNVVYSITIQFSSWAGDCSETEAEWSKYTYLLNAIDGWGGSRVILISLNPHLRWVGTLNGCRPDATRYGIGQLLQAFSLFLFYHFFFFFISSFSPSILLLPITLYLSLSKSLLNCLSLSLKLLFNFSIILMNWCKIDIIISNLFYFPLIFSLHFKRKPEFDNKFLKVENRCNKTDFSAW